MQIETVVGKSLSRFRWMMIFIIGVLLLSVALPQQVAFANSNDWQLQMIGADEAHKEGFKGQGIKIGVIDESFGSGEHGDIVKRVVKDTAPNASVSTYSVYKEVEVKREGQEVKNNYFETLLPYIVTSSESLTMTFDDGKNKVETQLEITVKDQDITVTSTSDDFTELKIIDGNKLQGTYVKDGIYQIIFNYAGMSSNSLAAEVRSAIEDQMDIINISLGTLKEDPTLQKAIQEAVEAGIIVVASSGNDGQYADKTYVYYPASDSKVISVGAVGEDGEYIEISNYGEVKAPGIYFTSDMEYYWGTSIAAPYVSGLTALYMNQQNSKDVKSLILNNKNDKGIVQYKSLETEEKEVPEVEEPDVPEVTDPETEAPDVPEVTDPEVEAPDVPEVTDPETEAPDVPEVTDPETEAPDVPEVTDPETEAPDAPEVTDPEVEAPDAPEVTDSETDDPSKKEESTLVPKSIKVELGSKIPTPIKAKQTIEIGDTASTIVTPKDLPENAKIIIKKVETSDEKVKNATNLEIAGDIYTIELIGVDPNNYEGTFTLTLNYNKDVNGTPAIYYYNEDTKKWEKRGGEINEKTSTISLEVEHFSTYGIFVAAEDEKVLTPIQEDPKDPQKPNKPTPVTPDLNIDNHPSIVTPNDSGDDKNQDKDKDQDKLVLVEDDSGNESKELPNTATSNYNIITVGFLLTLLGGTAAAIFRTRTM